MTKRGGGSASVDVTFLSLAFRPDGTSEEEDAAEGRWRSGEVFDHIHIKDRGAYILITEPPLITRFIILFTVLETSTGVSFMSEDVPSGAWGPADIQTFLLY